MNTVLSYLSTLKLSIVQWSVLLLSGAVGALVIALKAQGTKLHRAQIQLLLTTMAQSDTGKELAVTKARETFQAAYKDYTKAGGK